MDIVSELLDIKQDFKVKKRSILDQDIISIEPGSTESLNPFFDIEIGIHLSAKEIFGFNFRFAFWFSSDKITGAVFVGLIKNGNLKGFCH